MIGLFCLLHELEPKSLHTKLCINFSCNKHGIVVSYILPQKIFTMKTLIPFPSSQPNSTFNGFLVHSKLDTLDSSAKSVEKNSCDIFTAFGYEYF